MIPLEIIRYNNIYRIVILKCNSVIICPHKSILCSCDINYIDGNSTILLVSKSHKKEEISRELILAEFNLDENTVFVSTIDNYSSFGLNILIAKKFIPMQKYIPSIVKTKFYMESIAIRKNESIRRLLNISTLEGVLTYTGINRNLDDIISSLILSAFATVIRAE